MRCQAYVLVLALIFEGSTGFSSASSRLATRHTRLQARGGSGDPFSKKAFLRKPEFDFLSLRQFRRETILVYNGANQSEPIRILLSGLLAFFFALSPAYGDLMGEPLDGVGQAGSGLGFVGALAWFARERGRRAQQLIRIEREGDLGDLEVNFAEDDARAAVGLGRFRTLPLRDLRGEKRLLVLFGPAASLETTLRGAAPYARRFTQSQVLVVAAPTDGSAPSAWAPFRQTDRVSLEGSSGSSSSSTETTTPGTRAMSMAAPIGPAEWETFLSGLLADAKATGNKEATSSIGAGVETASASQGGFLALNFKGRSVGSGLGAPRWDELLGAKFPPAEAIVQTSNTKGASSSTSSATATEDEADLLACQEAFYAALTSGDEVAMDYLFAPDEGAVSSDSMNADTSSGSNGEAPEVSEVLASGGRLDGWSTCLADGARPAELVSFDCDATVLTNPASAASVASAEGYTTSIEAVGSRQGATNLSTQRWVLRNRPPALAEGQHSPGAVPAAARRWRLALHQTIPYSPNSGAGGLLRCDCRGCVALLASGSFTN